MLRNWGDRLPNVIRRKGGRLKPTRGNDRRWLLGDLADGVIPRETEVANNRSTTL